MEKRLYLFTSLLFLLLLPVFTTTIKANIPSILEIDIDEEDDQVIVITVSHGNPSLLHYVNEIQIELDGEVVKLSELDPQSGTQFTERYSIDSDVVNVRARANCNVHGWSNWVNYEINDDSGKQGIPGFPIESIIIGFIVLIIVSWILKKGH
jgi:desulfoferrodoxin (superoxide reductase-like protein)